VSYAIRNDGQGWRAVTGPEDVGADESFSETQPAPIGPGVPTVVTMRQARLALLQQGLLAQVNQAVAQMPGVDGDAARIEWEFSSTVERNRPLVQALVVALGLSSADLDELFLLAASL